MSSTRFTVQAAVKDAQEGTQTQRGSGLTAVWSLSSVSVYRLGAHSGKNVRACACASSLHYLMNVSHARAAAAKVAVSSCSVLLSLQTVAAVWLFLTALRLTSVGPQGPCVCLNLATQLTHTRLQQTGGRLNAFRKRTAFMCRHETHHERQRRSARWKYPGVWNGFVQLYRLDEPTCTNQLVDFSCVQLQKKLFSDNASIIMFSDHWLCTKLVCKTLRWSNSLLHLRFDQVLALEANAISF